VLTPIKFKNAVCVPKYQCKNSPITNHPAIFQNNEVFVKYEVPPARIIVPIVSTSAIPPILVEWTP
jgi:hypothetical protein